MSDMRERDRRDRALLRKLEEKDGTLRPERVVEAAKAKDHPWHDRFEWDDTAAAEQYRINQARVLIRSVEVRITTSEYVMFSPVYTRKAEQPGGPKGYVEVAKIASQEEVARASLEDELRRISGNIERSRGIAHQLGLVPEFEALLADIVMIRSRIKALSRGAEPEGPPASH